MVQSFDGGRKTVCLPEKAENIYRWEDGHSKWIATNAVSVEIILTPGIPEYIYWENE
jgi:hypothetical protein